MIIRAKQHLGVIAIVLTAMAAVIRADGLAAQRAADPGAPGRCETLDSLATPSRAQRIFGLDRSGPLVAVARTERNTFVFNHRDLRAEGSHPYVLEVDDGGYFQVLFKCTAPAFFSYTITGDLEAQPNSAEGATLPESVAVNVDLTNRGITMRHDARFLRYRVTARLREGVVSSAPGKGTTTTQVTAGAPPKAMTQPPPYVKPVTGETTPKEAPEVPSALLYGVTFDIWVVTRPEWKLGVIGGVAVSGLSDRKFFVKTDGQGKKTFEEDRSAADQHHADVVALAHAYYTKVWLRTFNLGMSFGIGTSGSSPRFFIGPSVVVGKYFVLTGGIASGIVNAPPIGQEIGQAPVNGDNTLGSLSTQGKRRGFIGIGFTWIDRRDQFAAALAAAATASGPAIPSCVTSATPADVMFKPGEGLSQEVTVDAPDGCTWFATVVSGGGPFSVTPATGKGKDKIEVSVEAPTGDAHADVVNVTGPLGSAPKPIKLKQEAKPASCVDSLSSGDTLNLSGRTKGEFTVNAKSACDWTIAVEPADAGFSAAPAAEKETKPVTVTGPEPGDSERTAVFKVTGPKGADPKTVTVRQSKK